MPAAYTGTLAGGAYSTEITVTPNAVFSIMSSNRVTVEAKNATADTWSTLGHVEDGNKHASFIAPSETIRILSNRVSGASVVEVYTD